MSRDERTSFPNTRSFFYGAEDAAKEAYDAMGQAIQEAEEVVEGAFEALEESIDPVSYTHLTLPTILLV